MKTVHETVQMISAQDSTSIVLEVSIGLSEPMEYWKADQLISQDELQAFRRY